MLDIQFIRANPELVAQKSREKGYQVDIAALLKRDEERRELLQKVEALRAQRNELSAHMKGGKPDPTIIERSKHLKDEVALLENKLETCDSDLNDLRKQVPNMPLDDVPVGANEEENVIVKEVGTKPTFNFEPKTHWEILETAGMLDKERAAKISGSRFAYLKGPIVQLQFAIIQFVMQNLSDEVLIEGIVKDNGLGLASKSFVPILPPAMLRTEPYVASARLDAENMTYKLENDDLWLNASAEHTLCTMYWDEVLPADSLPIRYIGYSTSFRREAGTYGKDTEGIIRLHQFDKLEMEVFSSAETGYDEHKLLIAIQEYFMQQLELPYRFLQKCTADIGKPNASGVDIECWYPGQARYIETHTADYMTDYQARDLKIRIKRDDGVKFVHTNDATAFALGRILAAIVENYQLADGSVQVPKVLQPYLGGREVI